MRRRDFQRGLHVGFAALLLLASAAAPAETILQRGNKDEPETLDPHKSDGLQEYWIQSDLFEGLTRMDPHGKVAPGVAESWDVAPDGLSWTFHLRPDLKWSDGSALTSEDFVWSLRRALDPTTAASYASILYPIANARAINEGTEKDLTRLGVTAPDPHTVVIRLNAPTAYLGGVLTLGIAFPLPRKTIETYGADWTHPEHFVGDGAFVLESWTPQLEVKLKRSPTYYDAASVQLDGVVWSVNESDETALKRYRSGALDIARVPHKLVPVVKTEFPGQLRTTTELWTRYLLINNQRPPLNDVRVRQALARLIDREAIAEKVDPHGQTIAYALVPPTIDGYTPQPPDWVGQSLEDRRKQAVALLQEAGYGPANRLKIDVIYDGAEEDFGRLLTAMAAMVKPYGVDFVLQAVENQILLSTTRNHDHQMAYFEWIADYPDPWTFLSIFRSDAGGLNTADYRNPEFDAQLDKSAAELDPAARLRLLESAEKLISRDMPVIPISYDLWPRVVNPKITGYFDNALDQHQSRDLGLER
ncbi:MAG: oligopeptide transport system substrate-binding protein [Aliidongia sp.]|nr:oligopeptide transport system substrate-binding protein [Aliidongia sp.]